MQDKRWPWVLLLIVGVWLATGRPGFDVLPGGDDAPFAVPDGELRALIVHKKLDSGKLTPDQRAVIDGATLRRLPSGHWAVREPDQDLSRDEKWVQDAAQAVKAKALKPPAMSLSNGKTGDTIPLPANEAALGELYTKHGG